MTAILTAGMRLLLSCGDAAFRDTEKPNTVRVALFTASKCERAADLIRTLTPIVEKMQGAVRLQVDYIGRAQDGDLFSLLGPSEIQGDILGLCAQAFSNRNAFYRFLGCMSEDPRKVPKQWTDCAASADLDSKAMKTCLEGPQGKTLLRESFARAAEVRAVRSPVLFIDDARYTGLLTEPALGRAFCRAAAAPKPTYCASVPKPVSVAVTVIEDRRCTDRSCNTDRIVSTISKTLEGANVTRLDYSSPEAKQRFRQAKLRFLPAILFGRDIEKDSRGYARLRGYLRRVSASDEWVYPLGSVWDPSAEICDDGVDNDEDGATDCADDACRGTRECRAPVNRRLTLFAMSKCAFSLRAVEAVDAVLKQFRRDRKRIDFRLEFTPGAASEQLTALHGPAEVEENIRQLCAQSRYGERYRFMEYVLCRAEMFWASKGAAPEETDWTACAKKGISAEVIRACAEGEEGRALLDGSYAEAAAVKMTGAPRWLVNNRMEVAPSSAETLKAAYCAENSGLPECTETLSPKETLREYCGGRPDKAALQKVRLDNTSSSDRNPPTSRANSVRSI